MKKYWYGFNWNNDITFYEGENTIKRTLELVAREHPEEEEVCIGKAVKYVPVVDANVVIDHLQEDAVDVCGKAAKDFLVNVDQESRKELEILLNKVYRKWENKYKQLPSFCEVVEVSLYEIKTKKYIRPNY